MMDKKEIFNKIGAIVTEIHDQHTYLSENPDDLNELELELFLANSKFLSGHIEVFQKLNRSATAEKPILAIERPVIEPAAIQGQQAEDKAQNTEEQLIAERVEVIPAPRGVDEKKNRTVNKIYLDVEPIEDEFLELEQEETLSLPVMEQTEKAIIQEIEIVTSPPPSNHLSVIETEHVPTVNEIISAQLTSSSTLATQFTAQPVKDLRSIINLNDKLLFIKDLFNGYNLAYSEAVELLNRFANFEAADNFLKSNYAIKNNWASKQSTVDHFYEILNRRFSR